MIAQDALVVGCDAGGSSVAAVAFRGGEVVGRGAAEPANPSASGIAAAAEAIATAVTQAVGASPQVAALYVGAAGAGRSSVARGLERALRGKLPFVASLAVEDDTRIALRAAIPSGPGVVVIAGTGSVAYAEHGDARVRVGGAGFLIGDEGSGFAIGRAALRTLFRVYDGTATANALTAAVERALGVSSRDELLSAVYAREDRPGSAVALTASLAPPVLLLAARRDDAARAIARSAAADLASLAVRAAQLARLDAPRIAFSGGLIEDENVLTELLRTAILAALPAARFAVASEPPESVAARLALQMLAQREPA